MAHFARVDDSTNTVIQVIVVDNTVIENKDFPESEDLGQKFIASIGLPGTWLQTSYNGKFRKNYAGADYVYDEQKDAFIPPKPHKTWILDDTSCKWIPPVPFPNDKKLYLWDDDIINWVEVPTVDSSSSVAGDNNTASPEPDYELE